MPDASIRGKNHELIAATSARPLRESAAFLPMSSVCLEKTGADPGEACFEERGRRSVRRRWRGQTGPSPLVLAIWAGVAAVAVLTAVIALTVTGPPPQGRPPFPGATGPRLPRHRFAPCPPRRSSPTASGTRARPWAVGAPISSRPRTAARRKKTWPARSPSSRSRTPRSARPATSCATRSRSSRSAWTAWRTSSASSPAASTRPGRRVPRPCRPKRPPCR